MSNYPGYTPPQQGQWGQQPAQGQGWGQAPPPNQQYPPQGPPQGYQNYAGAPPPQGGWNQPPPQGQYGQQWPPQPNQYQAPGQQFNQPPPPQQYGNWGPPPAQPGYGSPAPQQPYGAPPAQPAYGSPAPQQPYGAPPAQPPFGSAPPMAQYPPTPASLGYGEQQTANINLINEAKALRRAMKGMGTDEKVLINVLSKKDPIQINTLREQYNKEEKRNLIADLESETSGYLEEGLVQIVRGPLDGDCYTLYKAMKGAGTKEAALDDVLVGRSNADINAIKARYLHLYKGSLEEHLRGDLSGGTEQMYMMIIAARRAEDSYPVIPQEIDHAVTQLQSGMGNVISKNNIQVCEILTSKNDAQLRAIAQTYQQRYQKPLEDVVKSKFSGHMEDALLLLLARAQNRPKAEAVRLEESMAGPGTKDMLLVQRVVRCHWDQRFMGQVRDAYKMTYARDLVGRIEGETSGKYERLLVACVK